MFKIMFQLFFFGVFLIADGSAWAKRDTALQPAQCRRVLRSKPRTQTTPIPAAMYAYGDTVPEAIAAIEAELEDLGAGLEIEGDDFMETKEARSFDNTEIGQLQRLLSILQKIDSEE